MKRLCNNCKWWDFESAQRFVKSAEESGETIEFEDAYLIKFLGIHFAKGVSHPKETGLCKNDTVLSFKTPDNYCANWTPKKRGTCADCEFGTKEEIADSNTVDCHHTSHVLVDATYNPQWWCEEWMPKESDE